VKVDLGTLKLGAHLRGPMVLSLEEGEFLRFEQQAGVRVRVESGRLWITETERPDDVWLEGGEFAHFGSGGLTLVEAVHPTTLRIERAQPA
jgi:hypothetical protein